MMIEVASWTYLTLLSKGGAEKIISDYGVGRPEAVQPFQPSPKEHECVASRIRRRDGRPPALERRSPGGPGKDEASVLRY